MSLSAGTKLGPYLILGHIGAGGMGEVYKANDTRLDRVVAIKVSKTEFSERFEREAKAIAALNHPNICTLYDVGPNYLVMEYVEGAPLKGPLPLDQALKYAGQICDALDAAHKKGITHRDLKPANILATKTGIKLLDFGLAKLASAGTGQAPKPDDATLTMALTGRNEIVGTLYYMSPEQLQSQANGEEIDGRSDIFSFGLVLYEILTGKRAIEGSSPASVIASIMERPAPSIATIAPPALDHLLQRCLAKDPDDRWQGARDLKAELEWIASGSESGSAAPVAPMKKSRLSWVAWSMAALAIAGAAGVLLVHFREVLELPSYAYTIPPPPNSVIDSFAISPDGRAVAIAARANGQTSLWVRALDSFELRELSGTDGAVRPFWSPDGRFISFAAGPVQKKIPAAGGPATTINIGTASRVPGGSWNRDGVILLQISGGIYRVSASGGALTALLESPFVLTYPFFLPDDRRFLYTLSQGPEENRGVYVGSLDSKETRRLLPDSASSVYAPPRPGTSTGHVILGRDGSLVAQPVDGGTLRPAGELIPIAEKANTRPGTFSVSTTGILLYQNGQSILTKLTFMDRSGKELMAVGEPAGIAYFAVSPEEKRVVISRANLTANASTGQDLWMYDLEHQTASRFITAATNTHPVWSPDGTKVAFSSNRAGRTDLYEKPATGAVAEQAIYTSKDSPKSAFDWTRDGKFLLYVDILQAGKRGADIFALPAAGGKPLAVIEAEFNQTKPQLSPDNRWLAYVSDESGRSEIYIQPFSLEGKPAAQRWQISASGGTDPRWRRDGREFFFLAADQKLMSVAIRPATEKAGAAEFAFDSPQPLFPLPPMNGTLGTMAFRYAVTADGKRFLVLEDSGNSVPAPITVLTNWQAGLKK